MTESDQSQKRKTTKMLKITPEGKERLREVKREGETFDGALQRAIDALERDYETVREAAREGATDALEGRV